LPLFKQDKRTPLRKATD